jgi:hypothetical protein
MAGHSRGRSPPHSSQYTASGLLMEPQSPHTSSSLTPGGRPGPPLPACTPRAPVPSTLVARDMGGDAEAAPGPDPPPLAGKKPPGRPEEGEGEPDGVRWAPAPAWASTARGGAGDADGMGEEGADAGAGAGPAAAAVEGAGPGAGAGAVRGGPRGPLGSATIRCTLSRSALLHECVCGECTQGSVSEERTVCAPPSRSRGWCGGRVRASAEDRTHLITTKASSLEKRDPLAPAATKDDRRTPNTCCRANLAWSRVKPGAGTPAQQDVRDWGGGGGAVGGCGQ